MYLSQIYPRPRSVTEDPSRRFVFGSAVTASVSGLPQNSVERIQTLWHRFSCNVSILTVGGEEGGCCFRIGDVTAMTAVNATVGFYEGGYVLVANKDYEDAGDVAITVKEGKSMARYNKATGIWEDFDGQMTLAAGDGELIRIF